VALLKTGVSEELVATIIRVKRLSELGATLILEVFFPSVLQLLVTANVVPSILIPSTLMMKAISSPEMSVLTRTTLYHIPKDGIFQNL
jgi:hypothetical protein